MKSVAHIATTKPQRYAHQLVDHMGHKIETSWDGTTGLLNFPERGVVTLTLGDNELIASAEGPAEAMDKLEDVVARHLVRFGQRDELTCEWVRESE